jgi:hypothetical protein
MKTSPLLVKGCKSRAFEEGGIFVMLYLLQHGALVFPVSFEGKPHSVASYDRQEDVEEPILIQTLTS